jgi:membrane-bound ClpP family serine protease
MTGRTVSQFNPTGIVEIAGVRMPGRSEGEWIEAGVEVVVVAESDFGVVVRPQQAA